MARVRKAWLVTVDGFDEAEIVYAERAAQARYYVYLECKDVDISVSFAKIHVHRAQDRDVILPDEHWLVKELTLTQRHIVARAYGYYRRCNVYRGHYYGSPGDMDLLRLSWNFGLFTGPCGERAYGDTGIWGDAFFYLTSLGKEVAASMLPTYPR
ncbi:conserved hypothetical protein [Azospirillaceae bacterium]